MKKVIFTSNNITSAGSGIFCKVSEDNRFIAPIFVSVNHLPNTSSLYTFYFNGSINHTGLSYSYAEEAWQACMEMLGATEIYPVKERQLKRWFGDIYKTPLAEFKEQLSKEKMEEREKAKLKKKKASQNLWLKNNGFWNQKEDKL